MCLVLAVRSKNFYSFQKRKVSAAGDPTHQEMIALIKGIAKFSDIFMALGGLKSTQYIKLSG
jgi:putative transposase